MAGVENLLANFVLFIVLLSVYKHPTVESKVRPIMDRLFFQEKDLNVFFVEPVIKTTDDVQMKKDLNTEKWKYKIEDEDNLVTLLLLIKRILSSLTITLTKFAGFCEKLKNIILWKEPIRTSIFIVSGLIIYCIISIVPVRWVILAGVLGKFAKGVNFYKNRRTRNEEVARSTINFIIKRFFPTYYHQIWRNPSSPWPTTFNFANFQKKVTEQLMFRLQVSLEDNALYMYKTPKELINALSTCSKSLKFKTSPEEKATLGLVRWKQPKFTIKNLLNFIMNAPSDYYRVVHPRVINVDACPEVSFQELVNE